MDRIKVAIIGGSITGLSLAHGLRHHPQISFTVFEKRSSFINGGAGISLSKNADKALTALGLPVEDMMKSAGAVQAQQVDILAGFGEHKGESLADLSESNRRWVDRSRWLEQLLKGLPEDRLLPDKVLQSMTQDQGSGVYHLKFEDGSAYEADVVVGCDGVHSRIRRFILSPEYDDKVEPVFAGLWDAHGEMSPEEAPKKFGTELFPPGPPRVMAIAGDGACIMFNPYDDGTKYRVMMSGLASADFDPTTWRKDIDRDFLEQYYPGDEKLRDGVIDILLADTPRSRTAFSQFEHPGTPTYIRDRACVIGDAAHAVGPWMAQGACLATEACAVFAAILGAVSSKAELPAAMKAYDQIRRPRVEGVRGLCWKVARVLTGQYGVDPNEIADLNPQGWWDYVAGIDMKAHIAEALQLFESNK